METKLDKRVRKRLIKISEINLIFVPVTQTQEDVETQSVMVMMKMGMMVTGTMVAFILGLYDGFAPQSYVPARCLVMHIFWLLATLKILP